MNHRCKRCGGDLEPIHRLGKVLFWFCREKQCKIPYDDTGAMIIDPGVLASGLNPLARARELSVRVAPGIKDAGRTALEALFIAFMLDVYQAGMKDGILLAINRDFVPDDPPVAPPIDQT